MNDQTKKTASTVAMFWIALMIFVAFALIPGKKQETPEISQAKIDEAIRAVAKPTATPFAKPVPETPARSPKEDRENWARAYQTFVSAKNQHLNWIEYRVVKSGKGYALYATHEFFTQYSFSAGEFGKEVSNWIDMFRDHLRKAGFVRVRVWGKGEYSSGAWFNLN
jgi:hypothetical protein